MRNIDYFWNPMSHSRRERHRDRDPGPRAADPSTPPAENRVFRLTDTQRQQVARALRYIDAARHALESQQNPDNREIIRELKASADRIFDVMDAVEEIA